AKGSQGIFGLAGGEGQVFQTLSPEQDNEGLRQEPTPSKAG
ncbi:unnamed protein product, partial [marine sediment metagenome]